MANRLHLLDLPVDIVALILKPFLTTPLPIPMRPWSTSPVNPLPILLVHPAIYNIAAPIFYKRNLFVLDITGGHARSVRRLLTDDPSRREYLDRRLLLTTKDALVRIGKLELRVDSLRGWLVQGVVSRVQEMIVEGGLEHLTVLISAAPRRSSTPDTASPPDDADDTSIFTRPPLDSLLRVLADPYLRSASLWVDAAHHPRAWCRFHRFHRFHTGASCGGGATFADDVASPPPPPSPPSPQGNASSGRDGFVEIDWRRVLGVVDPSRRDVAAAWAEDPDVMRLR